MLQKESNWRATGALVALLGVTAVPQMARAAGTTYKVTPSGSTFTVIAKTDSPIAKLKHTRTLHSTNYTGAVVFSAPNKPSSVTMSVKADSLRTVIEGDLNASTAARCDMVAKRDILAADKYPTINFKSTNLSGVKVGAGGAFKGTMKGNLTLHGVTKPVSVPVSGKVSGSAVNAKGSFVINQTDYGCTIISIMGGMLKAQDPVTIDFNLVAKK